MRISVILPVYNESECIAQTFDSVLEYAKRNPACHFIFVNDGSTDNTKLILENKLAAAKSHQIRLVSYRHNQGKGYAVKTGIFHSDGDYICFIDSDLAYSLAHLEILIDKLESFEIVIGCRNLVHDSVNRVKFDRKLAGKIFNYISRKILALKYTDMQAGIKGFRKEVAKRLFEKQKLKRFCFDAELIYLAKKHGYTLGEIPAIVSDRHRYKASKVNLLKDSIKMLMSLIKIKVNDQLCLYE